MLIMLGRAELSIALAKNYLDVRLDSNLVERQKQILEDMKTTVQKLSEAALCTKDADLLKRVAALKMAAGDFYWKASIRYGEK